MTAYAIKQLIDKAIGTGAARALTIDRTETYSAYKSAVIETLRDRRIRYYMWISENDNRTCDICEALHGTIHEIDEEPFIHPNCRCVLIPVEL